MLSLIISIVLRMIVATAPQPSDGHFIRTQVADGSVWADLWESHAGSTSLRATVRLRDADPRLRFVPVDVDGDGRLDVVAFALDGTQLQLWRGSADGFLRVQ